MEEGSKLGDEIISVLEEISSSVSGSRIFWRLLRNGEMSLSEIIRQTNLNHSVVKKRVSRMVEMGLVKEKSFGRIRIYAINQGNPNVRLLLNLVKKTSCELLQE
ncbi:MAG: winged helix-turn-helix transcriptional regulator [Candidatus Brockarchaeota archaeon]|nr:winged helix-turn-helix transcriptional regulator [Candidatus Brockarchaeota archaeon]